VENVQADKTDEGLVLSCLSVWLPLLWRLRHWRRRVMKTLSCSWVPAWRHQN